MNSSDRNQIRELIQETMRLCEQFACGGIGETGPTQDDLNEAIKLGRVYADDDSFHRGQQIWINLNKLSMLINKP